MSRIKSLMLCCLVLLTLVSADPAGADWVEPAGTVMDIGGLQLLPVLFTDDGELIQNSAVQPLSKKDRHRYLVRFESQEGPLTQDQVQAMLNVGLFLTDGANWHNVKQIVFREEPFEVFDLIFTSTATSHLNMEAARLMPVGSSTSYSLAGLPNTGECLVPVATPSPEPTVRPTSTPVPGYYAQLGGIMRSILDGTHHYDEHHETEMPELPGKLVVAEFYHDSSEARDISLDAKSLFRKNNNVNHWKIPVSCLANTWDETETIILIYGKSSYYGKYTNGTLAYSMKTMMAVIHGNDLTVIAVGKDDPPQTKMVDQFSSNTYGDMLMDEAAEVIRVQLQKQGIEISETN